MVSLCVSNSSSIIILSCCALLFWDFSSNNKIVSSTSLIFSRIRSRMSTPFSGKSSIFGRSQRFICASCRFFQSSQIDIKLCMLLSFFCIFERSSFNKLIVFDLICLSAWSESYLAWSFLISDICLSISSIVLIIWFISGLRPRFLYNTSTEFFRFFCTSEIDTLPVPVPAL